jgi:hypothetical protein
LQQNRLLLQYSLFVLLHFPAELLRSYIGLLHLTIPVPIVQDPNLNPREKKKKIDTKVFPREN